jgi:hypothetical protein
MGIISAILAFRLCGSDRLVQGLTARVVLKVNSLIATQSTSINNEDNSAITYESEARSAIRLRSSPNPICTLLTT